MKPSRESVCIIAICGLDLITTIWLLRSHGAQEANPLMRYFLDHGVLAFALAKAAFCLGPVALIEWARRRHPVFVRGALRTGIALYIGFYGMVVWKVNQPQGESALAESQAAAFYRYAAMPISGQEIVESRARLVDR